MWNTPEWAPIGDINAFEHYGHDVETASARLTNSWNTLRLGYIDLTPGVFAEAKNFVSPLDEKWWPLIELIRLMQLTWPTASTGAPYVLELIGRMQKVISQGSHYISSVDRFLATIEQNPELGDYDTTLVKQMHHDITVFVAHFRSMWEELRQHEQLSSQWAAQTRRKWLGAIPEDVQELWEIGKSLVLWAADVEKQRKVLALHRETICTAVGIVSSRIEESWYKFGNPTSRFIVAGVLGEYSFPLPESELIIHSWCRGNRYGSRRGGPVRRRCS
jgi:hypothetical protein